MASLTAADSILVPLQCEFYALEGVSQLLKTLKLVQRRLNGFIAVIKHLNRPVAEWQPGGVPLTSMMTVERRLGKDKPVIRKALVELNGAPFAACGGSDMRDGLDPADINPLDAITACVPPPACQVNSPAAFLGAPSSRPSFRSRCVSSKRSAACSVAFRRPMLARCFA